MHWADRREKFRAVLESLRCVYPASVFDSISARLEADLGYEVGMSSGWTIAAGSRNFSAALSESAKRPRAVVDRWGDRGP